MACECGGRLEYQHRYEAQELSVFDRVKYERSYYAGCTCGKGKAPLDEGFGLQGGQVTAGLADLLAMTGAELVFEHSGCFLERFLFFQVSENTVGKETEYFGQLQTELEANHLRKAVRARIICKNVWVLMTSPRSGCTMPWMGPRCALKKAKKRPNQPQMGLKRRKGVK